MQNRILRDHHEAALEAAHALLKWARQMESWERRIAANQSIDDDEFMAAFADVYGVAMEVVEYPNIDALRDFIAEGKGE